MILSTLTILVVYVPRLDKEMSLFSDGVVREESRSKRNGLISVGVLEVTEAGGRDRQVALVLEDFHTHLLRTRFLEIGGEALQFLIGHEVRADVLFEVVAGELDLEILGALKTLSENTALCLTRQRPDVGLYSVDRVLGPSDSTDVQLVQVVPHIIRPSSEDD